MITLPAPSFGAAGLSLAAPYTLDFSKDLNYLMPAEGTWQGDRKKGQSLYVDNYSNNISITVSSGNYSIRIPAFTAAYIDLRGFNDIAISSDSAGTTPNSARLSTEVRNTEMISRGNAPVSNVITSLQVNGPISLSGNTPGLMVYSQSNKILYAAINNNTKLAKIDVTTNKVLGSVSLNRSFNCMVAGASGFIYFGCVDGTLAVLNTGNDSVSYYSTGNTNTVYCIEYLPGFIYMGYGQFGFLVMSSSSYGLIRNLSVSGTLNNVCVDPVNSLVFIGDSGASNFNPNLYRYNQDLSTQQSATYITFAGTNNQYAVCSLMFDSVNSNVICGGYNNSNGIVAISNAFINPAVPPGSGPGTTFKVGMNPINPLTKTYPGTKNCYLVGPQVYIVDTVLFGISKTLQASSFGGSLGGGVARCPDTLVTYVAGADGIYYIND